jgi:1-acyl-sn-glycerol-3-phosphate acyltransferase
MRSRETTAGERIPGAASDRAGEYTHHPLPTAARVWRVLRVAALFLLFALFTAAVTVFASVRRRERFTRWWAGMVLRALGVKLMCGRSPAVGAGPALLVANHVSSIDSILICAIQPACFVAKSELGNSAWLRWLLAEAGTIFIDRGKRDDVLRALAAMHEAFDACERVALFPEATICATAEPRPFNSALLEPGSDGVPLYFVALSLTRADGTPCPEADFPRGRSFAAGFWRLAGVPALVARAEVVGPVDLSGVNRKRIARSAYDAIRCALSGRAGAPEQRKPALYSIGRSHL